MDIFYGNLWNAVEGDWNSIEKLPNIIRCKLKVKLSDYSEVFAYFYEDKAPIMGEATHHFWNCSTKDYIPIESISHWKHLKDE